MRFCVSALLFIFLCSCSSIRKISHIEGVRQPASSTEAVINEQRLALKKSEIPKVCPGEIKTSFSIAVTDYVPFPACPALYQSVFESSLNYLKIDERAVLEEVLKSNCRSLGWGAFGDSLESILQNFDITGPLGRKKEESQTTPPAEKDIAVLLDLKKQIEQIVSTHIPLDRWVKAHGQMIIPDIYLSYLQQMIVKNKCSISEDQFDEGFQLVKDLQELNGIMLESPPQKNAAQFLEGLKIILDKKIGEYFKP